MDASDKCKGFFHEMFQLRMSGSENSYKLYNKT